MKKGFPFSFSEARASDRGRSTGRSGSCLWSWPCGERLARGFGGALRATSWWRGRRREGGGEAAGGEAADGSCRGFEGTVGLGASAERTHVIVRADLASSPVSQPARTGGAGRSCPPPSLRGPWMSRILCFSHGGWGAMYITVYELF